MVNPRKKTSAWCQYCVTLLIGVISLTLTGCSVLHELHDHTTEYCNSRAYVQIPITDHLTTRFDSDAPVRLGVIPFSVPANLAPRSGQAHTLGNELAWNIHREMLSQGIIPISEVLNREDWPGKRDEFFHGNFGAIASAREAGYDLVLVGYVDPIKALDTVTAQGKLIEVDSGITLWYGTVSATSARKDVQDNLSRFWLASKRPDMLNFGPLTEKLARCIVEEAVMERVAPE